MDLHPDDRLPETPATRHRDYILTDYVPRRDPAGRLHAASLLRSALRREGLLDAIWPMIEALQAHLGQDETVWGTKWGPSGFGLELYFYNFNRNSPENRASATKIVDVLAPWVAFPSRVAESIPYFMFSFELTAAGLAERRASPIRLYVGTGDKHRRQAGFSYRVDGERLFTENHYWFYKPNDPRELEDAVLRVQNSVRSGSKRCWPVLIPKHLRDCHTICFAVKPAADGLYYSRIGTDALLAWLRQHRPGPIAEILARHAEDFAHVAWDLGFDFDAPPGAESVAIGKYAIHGVV